MARKAKVTEFFDTAEGKKQLEAVKGFVDEYVSHLDKVKPIKNLFGDAQKPSEYVNGLKQMNELQEKQNKIVLEGVKATEKMVSSKREFDKAMIESRVEKQKYNNELKTEIQLTNASAGSIERAKAAIKSLTAERDKLNLSTEEGKKRQKELNDEIDKQNTFIKENVDAQSKQRLNVGNYQGSAKIIVDALERVKIKVVQAEKSFGAMSPEAAAARREMEGLQRVVDQPQFLNIAAKVGDANGELRGMTKTLIDLERQGLGGTDFANELRKHLAQLQDEISDTRSEIKALSSDTRTFDLFASSVSFASDVFQTAAGAATAFGASEEDAAQATKTLLAIQTVSNGVKGIANELTTRGTAANKAYVAVQTLWKTATDASAASNVRFAASMKLLLGGLAIGALALLIIKLKEYADAAGQLSLKQKTLNDVGRAAADTYGKEKSQLDLLVSSIQTEGISRAEKFAILKKLQDNYPGYFDSLKTEKDLNEKLADAYKRASEGILQKANAEAAANLLSENASKRLTAQIDLQEKIQKLNQYEREGLPLERATRGEKGVAQFRKMVQGFRVSAAQEFGNVVKDIEVQNDLLITTIQDANKEIEKLGGKTTKTPATKDENDAIEKDLKARFELYKLAKQKEIDLLKSIAGDQNAPFAARYSALMDSVIKEESLIKDQREFDLKNQKLTENEKKLIVAKSEDEILKIRTEAGTKLIQIQTDNKEAQKKILDDLKTFRQGEADKEIDDLSNNLAKQIDAEQKAADFAIQFELGRYKLGQISKEQYENKKLEIENDFRRKSLLFEIDYYEKLLKIANLGPEKEAEALQKLSALRKQLNDLDVKNTEDSLNKQDKALSDFLKANKEKLIELGNALKDTLFSLLEGGVDRRKNELQEEIDLLEKRTQKEIEAASQTSASEQDKAAKIAIINARAQAQKEQLEKRQRQLDEQKARFEKARAVTDVIQNTAMAVSGYLAEQNYPLAIIAGAIGAAQLIKILAQPIPKYFKGRSKDDPYEGPAIVGDGGKSELIIREDGTMEVTPNTPTLTNVYKGDEIKPDAEKVFRAAMSNQASSVLSVKEKASGNSQSVEKAIEKMGNKVVQAIKNKQENHIVVENPLRRWVKYGNSSSEYLK